MNNINDVETLIDEVEDYYSPEIDEMYHEWQRQSGEDWIWG